MRRLKHGLDHELETSREADFGNPPIVDGEKSRHFVRFERPSIRATAKARDELRNARLFFARGRLTREKRIELLDRTRRDFFARDHVLLGENLRDTQRRGLVVETHGFFFRNEIRRGLRVISQEVANGVVVLEPRHSPNGRFARNDTNTRRSRGFGDFARRIANGTRRARNERTENQSTAKKPRGSGNVGHGVSKRSGKARRHHVDYRKRARPSRSFFKILDAEAKISNVRPVRLSSLTALLLAMTLSYAPDAIAQTPEFAAESSPSVGYSLRAGVEVGARWFVYSDPLVIATNLRPYDVVGVPLLTFGGELRPLVWSRVPVLEHVGISFDYAFAPVLESSTSNGEEVRTSWDHGDLTLRVPIRFGKQSRAPQIIPNLGYGWIGFSFAASDSLAAEIPTVGYHFVRMGLIGKMPLNRRFSVTAAFDYLSPRSGGSVYERFRDPTIDGIDANLGLEFEMTKEIRASLTLDYTRFFSSFVPVPGDAYVAGGALDQFGSVKIGIEYGQ